MREDHKDALDRAVCCSGFPSFCWGLCMLDRALSHTSPKPELASIRFLGGPRVFCFTPGEVQVRVWEVSKAVSPSM